jgi:VIT1/CCC1 family predicted Fe2+/Mn2+ transporter
MEDEKLVLIKEDEKELILNSLTELVDEIQKSTSCLKESICSVEGLLENEIKKFENKMNEAATQILIATNEVERLLTEN